MDIEDELSVPLLQGRTDVPARQQLPPTARDGSVTELRFALDGLSCSSCTNTVKKAVESIEGIDFLLVTVSLLPEQLLTVQYSCDDTTLTLNSSYFSVSDRIIESVQHVGFDAILLSHQQLTLGDHNSRGKSERLTGNSAPSSSTSARLLFIRVEYNASIAWTFFQQSKYVISVEPMHPSVHHTSTKTTTLFKALRYSAVVKESTRPGSAFETTILDDTPTTFKVKLDQQAIGIRDLLQILEKESEDQGGVGSITVLDPTSYKLHHDAQEQRRTQEVESWKNGFLYSIVFSIPVVLFAMVFPNFPRFNHVFISGTIWNIRYDELLQLVLSTPVQFVPGARFYRDSYFSIKARSLGMSFLIASGTTAAYLYSCYVVYHNSRLRSHSSYNIPPPWTSQWDSTLLNMLEDEDDRMMPTFETSALLITFVYLGKYLECRAKGFASKAISQLAQLTPETAVLVGTYRPQKDSMDQTSSPDLKQNDDIMETSFEDTRLLNTSAEEMVPTLPLKHPHPIHYYDMESEISLALLQKNDVLLVRPGQRIPTDGTIILGTASLDESVITGESVPVTKTVKQPVIAGTHVVEGSIHILVTHLGDENTISQIIRLIETAQSSKPPMQAFADRISRIFAPAVFLCAIGTYIVWCVLLNTIDTEIIAQGKYEGFNTWTFPLLFAISVLVVACPCALGLAVPTAVMVGSGVGAKNGILIKNGESLEQMNSITAVAIDKTGTVTDGNPSIEDIILLSQRCYNLFRENNMPTHRTMEDSLLLIEDSKHSQLDPMTSETLENIFFLAACVENRSQHPLAKGIIAKAATLGIGQGLKRQLVQVDDFVSEVGYGVQCSVKGVSIFIGNRRGLDKNNIEISSGTFEAMEKAEKRGQTAVVISVNGRTEAVIGFIDKAKDDACLVMSILQHAMGIKVYMLTGDNHRTARIIAGKIGIPEENIVADLLPNRKVDFIQRLQAQNEKVAMIGDGINDSPALAAADVGIAIAAGTDIAMESAGIVLVNSRLTDVLTAFTLSKNIYNRIRLNIIWALGYNICAIPLAAGVLYPITKTVMPPFVAATAMILSSLSVLTSSLLLNNFQPPTYEKEYGHALRKGRLGLERVKVNGTVTVNVRNVCESMEFGGPCSCKNGFCVCFPCEEHGNM